MSHDGSDGDVDGRMVYYKAPNPRLRSRMRKDFQFAFAMPLTNGKTGTQYVSFNTFQPSMRADEQENGVANWIQLTNVSEQAAGGWLRFFDGEGVQLGARRVDLESGQRFDSSGHVFGRNRSGMVEWMPDQPAARFQMRNVRYVYDNATWQESFTTAFQLEAQYGSGESLAVPLSTEGESSILEISNTLGTDVSTEVQIYGDDGLPIDHFVFALRPMGSRHIILDSVLGIGRKGLAVVKGGSPNSLAVVAMQYGKRV